MSTEAPSMPELTGEDLLSIALSECPYDDPRVRAYDKQHSELQGALLQLWSEVTAVQQRLRQALRVLQQDAVLVRQGALYGVKIPKSRKQSAAEERRKHRDEYRGLYEELETFGQIFFEELFMEFPELREKPGVHVRENVVYWNAFPYRMQLVHVIMTVSG